MLKRWWIYCKEMFPLLPYILMGFLVFFEIYFVLLLNYGVTDFNLGVQEIVCALTVFVFVFLLRIADDFKDYETDLIEHPERPLSSGRVKKQDLIVLLTFVLLVTFVLNFIFMNNFIFLLLVVLYGVMMSLWYHYSEKMQNNFVLMMFMHTPYLVLMNIYVISFAVIKYGLDWFSYITVLLAFTVYFIGFIRGMAREIKVIKNDDKSKNISVRSYEVSRYKKDALFVAVLAFFDTIVNVVLLWNLNIISVIILIINLILFLIKINHFIKAPTKFKLVNKALIYIVIQEVTVALTAGLCLLVGKI